MTTKKPLTAGTKKYACSLSWTKLVSEYVKAYDDRRKLVQALKVAAWWLDAGDDNFVPPWTKSTVDHSEQQERVRQTVVAALLAKLGEDK